MLQLEGSEDYKNVTIFVDDRDARQFYLLPQFPRFRLDDKGRPAFGFVKYRNPVDRADGKKGGGLAAFDIELAVEKAIEDEIRARLEERVRKRLNLGAGQPVDLKIGRPTFTRGTVGVTILSGAETLVQRIQNAGKPSLFGNNVTAVQAEFTPEGAAVFEGVMQSKSGLGFVMVNYDLWFPARLPPISVVGWWHADKFYQFVQTVDVEDRFWSEDDYNENISEMFRNSEAYNFRVDSGTLDMTKPENVKLVQGIQDSMQKTMDEMVKRNMLEAIPPADRDVSKIRDQGYENIRRNFSTHKTSDVSLSYNQNMAADQERLPQGNLPALTAVTVNGKALVWADYAKEIDADDPFFRTLNLIVQVNADFANLPIFSVDVTLDYPPQTKKTGAATVSFRKPEDIGKFSAFIEGDAKLKYKYVVNYKGEARTFEHPWVEFEGKTLTVNVDDLGIWMVDIDTGDINFEQVDSAQLTVQYEDAGNVPLVEKQFTIDKDHRSHQIRELIFTPRNRPYRYALKYFMKGGREVQGPMREANGNQLYVNDPFSAMRTIGIRTKGDFDTRIDTIFLDLVYDDPDHEYRQTKSFAFSKAGKRFDDWVIPTIDEKSGKLTYSGNILYKDGSSSPIPSTEATSSTLLVGEDPLTLEVELVPDLIDWDKVKLAIVDLAYEDAGNGINLSKSVTLRKGGKVDKWVVNIKDKTKKGYSYGAKYFMTDGTKKEVPPTPTTETSLVLEVPA
jgi:hypothetical protein